MTRILTAHNNNSEYFGLQSSCFAKVTKMFFAHRDQARLVERAGAVLSALSKACSVGPNQPGRAVPLEGIVITVSLVIRVHSVASTGARPFFTTKLAFKVKHLQLAKWLCTHWNTVETVLAIFRPMALEKSLSGNRHTR